MALFQLWPPRSDPKFNPNGPVIPERGGSPGNNLMTPQLQLDIDEYETVALSLQPLGVEMLVAPQDKAVVKVERVPGGPPGTTIYKLTALAGGTTLLEARMPAPSRPGAMPSPGFSVAASMANLNIQVSPADVLTLESIFVGAFEQGLELSGGEGVDVLIAKIDREPLVFGNAVQVGCARGLLEGLVSLVKTLQEIAKIAPLLSQFGLIVVTAYYIYSAEFRAEVAQHLADAKRVALGMADVATDVFLHKNEYSNIFRHNGGPIGFAVGVEVGKQLTASIKAKSAAELGEWVGFIIGRVMFEVLLLLATEGIGMAANSAKVGGEGASIAARLLPKLRELLEPLAKIRAMARLKLTAKGAKVASEAVEVVQATLRQRAATYELARMLEEADQYYVWATFEKDVVANQTIKFTGRTNPDARPELHMLKGTDGLLGHKYGPYKVVIDGRKYRMAPVPTRAEEFYLDKELSQTEGKWFGDEELEALGKLKK